METVAYRINTERVDIVRTAEKLLKRTIEERTGIRCIPGEKATVDIVLDIENGIGEEGYRIDGDPEEPVRITGGDERGLLYGVGKFLRTSCLDDWAFSTGSWRGTSIPAKKVRGMYFATHFHNWYHDAPIDEIIRYVEELALWGCNTLSVWFDMHHYRGIDDPDARGMIARLRAILEAAERAGIRACITTLANEGYSTTPEHLKADWTDGHDGYFRAPGGHYHVEICPNAPGGLDLILKLRGEMLDAFSGVNLEYVWIWPYDQGGCTCARCTPWGANGFLVTAEPTAHLIRSKFPQAKIVLSTWYFDHFVNGEWEGLRSKFLENRPDWIDYLLIDDFGGFPRYPLDNGVPGDFPAVGFPEISMEGMWPWGGFGANPRPRHWQAYHDKTRSLLDGGFPYSEGIYEDLNKVLMLQWGWNPDLSAEDIIGEYAAGCLSADVAGDVLSAVYMMEEDHGIQASGEGTTMVYELPDLPKAERCFSLMNSIDSRLTDSVRHSWRWRILWLRSALDAELKRTAGCPSGESEAYLRELIDIYHAPEAGRSVHPPVSE